MKAELSWGDETFRILGMRLAQPGETTVIFYFFEMLQSPLTFVPELSLFPEKTHPQIRRLNAYFCRQSGID